MPNWCNNVVELSHEDPAMLERVKKAFTDGRLCDEFIPMPDELKGSTSPNRDVASAEQLEEKYGYTDWYSFAVNEWGTKWDVGGQDSDIQEIDENTIQLSFDSAWSPPLALFLKLETLDFKVKAYYNEPGMCFAGLYKDYDEEYYEYAGMSADEIEDDLPEELNEMFGISESVRDWERETEAEIDEE